MLSKFEEQSYEIKKRVEHTDLKLNFRALNDLLRVKFEQLEDVKQACRDMLVFQKYFYPLQVQAQIAKNFQHLDAAKDDFLFHAAQKNEFELALQRVETARKAALSQTDVDNTLHMQALTKHHLDGAWLTEPLANPLNDYVSDLL
jgi:hypothetical protein